MNLSSMSVGQLQTLRTRIEKEIEGRSRKKRDKAMEEIKSIVAKYGLKLKDVIVNPPARKSAKVATKKATARPVNKPAAILFRHPENPALTWSGGRGRPPQWITDWKASGRSLDEARIRLAKS